MSTGPVFERDALVDKPGIVGARWWHRALSDEQTKIARRAALKKLAIAGGVLAGFGIAASLMVKAVRSSSTYTPDSSGGYSDGRKTALQMQTDYGWSFGAAGEALVFDGVTTKPFDSSAMLNMTTAMAPAQWKLTKFWQPTLFQSPYATPAKLGEVDYDETAQFKKVAEVLKPISTPAMDTAYAAGQRAAELAKAAADGTALVVDLPGPEAVAFAAGASEAFDPVFLFDNWPHPRGVVRAHETLSAAAYYQPLFEKRREALVASGTPKPPIFVLDRRRLTPYSDESTQFDNRYVAKMPWPATSLTSLGVDRLLYVVPASTSRVEMDDLNDDFVNYAAANMELRAVSVDAIGPTDKWPLGSVMHPTARKTDYSSGGVRAQELPSRPRPVSFGTVPVLLAAGTGAVIGYKYARNGSWNRSTGGGYSG